MGAPGQIRMVTRTAFASVQAYTKYEGQEDLPMVAGLDDALAERIVSRPATGHRQIYNITWDPDSEELIIEVSETSAA